LHAIHEDVLGLFEPFLLQAFVRVSPSLVDKPLNRIGKALSTDEGVKYALARYTVIHELRHFHEVFGSLCGASLFFAHMSMLQSFAAVVEMTKRTDEVWTLPFPAWSRKSKFKEIYIDCLTGWERFEYDTARLLTAFRPFAAWREHPDDWVVDVATDLGGGHVPAFPLTLGIPEMGPRRFTVYYPVSLRTILEGSAQALQRAMAEAECPPEVASALIPEQFSMTTYASSLEATSIETIASTILPYNITDLMLSKYLRGKGYPRFERDAIMQVADLALNTAGIFPVENDIGTPVDFAVQEVGKALVAQVQGAPVQRLATANLEFPEVYTSALRGFLRDVRDWPRPADIEYRGDLMSPLRMIEGIVRHEIIVPLLEARLKTGHEAFSSALRYLEMVRHLPKVPVMEVGKGVVFAPYMTPYATDAWAKYVMLSHLMYQIYGGRRRLDCPRATGKIGQGGALNLAEDGECARHISHGRCSGCEPRRAEPLPLCHFSNALTGVGIRQRPV
jgi:hypothetical protein